jgi:hypothetical protein
MSSARRAFRAPLAPLALALAPVVSGCPLHDDYYVAEDANSAKSDTGGAGASTSGGQSGRDGTGTGGSGGGSVEAGTGSAGTGEDASGGEAGSCEDCVQNCTSARFRHHDYAFCLGDATYAQAEAACATLGMKLARVADEAENIWILQNAIANFRPEQIRAFLGASDAEKEGEWVWEGGVVFWRGDADGEAVSDRYVHWEAEQPANYSPVTSTPEDCLTINFADGTWNDMRCELPLPYVCEALE